VLADNPNIDRNRVHVQGGSYGGFMAAIMGSRYPQYFKSAIILNGVLNIMANLWFTDIPEWNTVEALSHSSLANLTEDDYRNMWRQSPASAPMKIPTLQFLGAKDRRVPYRQGLYFDGITKAAGTPITTYVYESSNHSLADSVETSMDIVIKSILFLEG
jgi:acylaminoacyl-peptidase